MASIPVPRYLQPTIFRKNTRRARLFAMSTPSYIIIATSLGLTLSTTFSIGSLGFSYAAIPAMLLPVDAPLLPPMELVTSVDDRQFRTAKAPKQPFDSGVGDEKETLLDAGGSSKVLRGEGKETGSPSTTSYLLRQWFHLFSKGMHALPPCTIAGAVCYLFCAVMLPGPLSADFSEITTVKRTCYVLATLLNVGAMVFTLTLLKPVNTALHERVKEVVAQEADVDENGAKSADVDDKRAETEQLIREWGRLNAYRAMLPLLAVVHAVIGLAL